MSRMCQIESILLLIPWTVFDSSAIIVQGASLHFNYKEKENNQEINTFTESDISCYQNGNFICMASATSAIFYRNSTIEISLTTCHASYWWVLEITTMNIYKWNWILMLVILFWNIKM